MVYWKGIWENKKISVLGIEQKTNFGDLLRIMIDETQEIKIVNSNYIKKIK